MHISSKWKKEILTCIEDCRLFAEVLQWTLYLSFPWPFFLCPYGSVLPHTESHIFPHHCFSTLTCLPLLYLASLLPPTLRCVMFPLWHLLMVPLPKNQGKREHLPHCFSYRRKVENTGRLWLVMQLSWCSKLPTFCSGNTREIHPCFRHYPPPELACELALAGSLLHSSYVEC